MTPERDTPALELAKGITTGTIALPQDDTARAAIDLAAALIDVSARLERLDKFSPTSEQINALPQGLRSYVHDLQTRCDPSGDIAALRCSQENASALLSQTQELSARLERARVAIENAPHARDCAAGRTYHKMWRSRETPKALLCGVCGQAKSHEWHSRESGLLPCNCWKARALADIGPTLAKSATVRISEEKPNV